MTQHQTTQPLNDAEITALLAIATGDMDILRECKLSSAYPLLRRGYITTNRQKSGCRLILTTAGRELIPSLVQNQAV